MNLSAANVFDLDKAKILSSGKELSVVICKTDRLPTWGTRLIQGY